MVELAQQGYEFVARLGQVGDPDLKRGDLGLGSRTGLGF